MSNKTLIRIGLTGVILGTALGVFGNTFGDNIENAYDAFLKSNPAAVASADSLRHTKNRTVDLLLGYGLSNDYRGNTNIFDLQNTKAKSPEFKAQYDSLDLRAYQLAQRPGVKNALETRDAYIHQSTSGGVGSGAGFMAGIVGLGAILTGIAKRKKGQ